MPHPGARAARSVLRAAPGLLVLAAYALPCVHGSGPLAGRDFTGLDLVRVVPGLASTQDVAWRAAAMRLAGPAALLVAVAAAWHLALGLLAPRHPVRPATAVCMALAALALAAVELWRAHGPLLPGAWAWLLAAALIAAPAARHARPRLANATRPAPVPDQPARSD